MNAKTEKIELHQFNCGDYINEAVSTGMYQFDYSDAAESPQGMLWKF